MIDKQVDTILFDFGGVLYKINVQKTIDRFSLLSGIDKSILGSQTFYDKHIAAYEKGIISSEQFRNEICTALGITIYGVKFDEIWLNTLVGMYNDSIEMSKYLEQYYRLILLSNTNELHHRKFSTECRGLFSHFESLYFSFEIKLLKPMPEIYRYVSQKTGINPERTLFIDDSQANIEAAKALGYKTIHLHGRDILSDLLHSVKKLHNS